MIYLIKNKKGVLMPFSVIIMFFILSTAVYQLALKPKIDRTSYVGEDFMKLVNVSNQEKYYSLILEENAKYAAYDSLKELGNNGGLNKQCSKFEDFYLIDDKCGWDNGSLINNYKEIFAEEFNERLKGSNLEGGYNFEVNSKEYILVYGERLNKLDIEQNNIKYSFIPRFNITVYFDLNEFFKIKRELIDNKDCLKSTEFNELTDDPKKIPGTCGFSSKYDWKIIKKREILLFEVKTTEELFFIKNINIRVAISLNTLEKFQSKEAEKVKF